MPIADFASRRNWGYDGVLLYAPDSAYGRPDDLRALIDEAHARGLMVLLDVVYNHFGPEGNYLHRYAPAFFAAAHTPWGHAIDYRVPQVRAFAIENALHWLQRYRFDGLRLDAVHAIVEPAAADSAGHQPVLGRLAGARGRDPSVLENDDNHGSLLDPRADPHGKIPGAMERRLSPRLARPADRASADYYRDCVTRAPPHRARGWASPTGAKSRRTDGAAGAAGPPGIRRWRSSISCRTGQIGNRPLGDRLATRRTDCARGALAVTLPPRYRRSCSWANGAAQPFPFLRFPEPLATAVCGRREEFKAAMPSASAIPDPLAEATFARRRSIGTCGRAPRGSGGCGLSASY